MKIVTLAEARNLEGQLKEYSYNCADTTGTREIADVLLPRLTERQQRTYAFERAMQGPAMTMMRRGVLVDREKRGRAIKSLQRELDKLAKDVNKDPTLTAVWDMTEKDTGSCPSPSRKDGKHKWPKGIDDADPEKRCVDCGAPRQRLKPFNPNSPDQVWHLFYDLLGAKPQKNLKGEVAVDDYCLRVIGNKNPDFKHLADYVLTCRDKKKQIGMLKSRLTSDDRMLSSMNVGGTWTFRWSSSKNPQGYGTNLQNLPERHRNIFIADPGYELFYADLERAESCLIAFEAGDEAYIEAHEGDTHTYVCTQLWPDLGWTGDPGQDKKVAKQNPPWDDAQGHDYRHMAKQVQHGITRGLKPEGISQRYQIPIRESRAAYDAFFEAFPCVGAWMRQLRKKVENQEELVNPLGISTVMFGRPWDNETWRAALSFSPQSMVASLVNLGIWQMWRYYDPDLLLLLAQVHDAAMGQFPRKRRDEALAAIRECMVIPVPVLGLDGKEREMTIPIECLVGSNWGKYVSREEAEEKGLDPNPRGMRVVEL